MKCLSKKLERKGHDRNKYEEFIERLKEDLIKRGFDPKDAESSAMQIAEMYGHHFRIWK